MLLAKRLCGPCSFSGRLALLGLRSAPSPPVRAHQPPPARSSGSLEDLKVHVLGPPRAVQVGDVVRGAGAHHAHAVHLRTHDDEVARLLPRRRRRPPLPPAARVCSGSLPQGLSCAGGEAVAQQAKRGSLVKVVRHAVCSMQPSALLSLQQASRYGQRRIRQGGCAARSPSCFNQPNSTRRNAPCTHRCCIQSAGLC